MLYVINDRKIAAEPTRNRPMRPEDILQGKNRPFTGAEFIESLRDGREVYLYGERVKDVTTHPAFANSAQLRGSSVRCVA